MTKEFTAVTGASIMLHDKANPKDYQPEPKGTDDETENNPDGTAETTGPESVGDSSEPIHAGSTGATPI